MRAVLTRAVTTAVVVILATVACSDTPTTPSPTLSPGDATSVAEAGDKLKDWLRGYPDNPGSPAPGASVLVGAGDIAECYQGSVPPPINGNSDAKRSAAEETAKLLDRIPGTVIAIGDNAYQFGSPFDYAACYEPTWGRHFERTFPALGNHEYMSGGSGYFAYFRERSGSPLGYYSYNEGSWHVIVLNSTPQVYLCRPPETEESWPPSGTPENPVVLPEPPDMTTDQGRVCAGDRAQQGWLVTDLSASMAARGETTDRPACTAVYFHHPRFSSGSHGNHAQMQQIWDILYQYGVDVAITGHDHNYERFAPQDRDGNLNPDYGIRQFVVGTGGADLRSVENKVDNSEVIITDTHGVIALSLNELSYGWAFIATDRSVLDSGSTQCHGPPPPPSSAPTS